MASPRDTFITVYGRRPVLEALGDPGLPIDKIVLATTASAQEIVQAAEARGVPVVREPPEFVTRLSGNGRHDQGVVADVRAPAMRSVHAFLQELEDLLVRRETHRGEHLDALGARPRGQAAQQFGRDPAVLPVIHDGDSDLRVVGQLRVPDVTGHAHEAGLAARECHERLVIVVIDLGEVPQLAGRQALHRAEEALVARFVAQVGEPLGEPLLVIRCDRADRDPLARPERGGNRGLAVGNHANH